MKININIIFETKRNNYNIREIAIKNNDFYINYINDDEKNVIESNIINYFCFLKIQLILCCNQKTENERFF